MTEYRELVEVPQDRLDEIEQYLTVESEDASAAPNEDETIIYTANFGNGVEMDIKCCGVQYRDDEDCNAAWSEAVLFYQGSEVACEYGEDEFAGEWELEYNGDTYVAEVIGV